MVCGICDAAASLSWLRRIDWVGAKDEYTLDIGGKLSNSSLSLASCIGDASSCCVNFGAESKADSAVCASCFGRLDMWDIGSDGNEEGASASPVSYRVDLLMLGSAIDVALMVKSGPWMQLS